MRRPGPHPRRKTALALWPVVALIVSACSSAQFDGRVYRGDDLAFRVGPVPHDWRQLQVEHTLLAFRDDADAATVALSGRCGKDGDDVPLVALTHHLFLQFTDREVEGQTILKLDGRDAMRTEMDAELDGVPKHYLVYVLKKDGCVYDFVRIGRTGGDTDDFEAFVHGFHTLS